MSWIERVKEEIIIVTGDGKQYRPLWDYYQKGVDFNFSEFTYPGIEGSRIDKKKAKGTRFEIKLIFTGADHLDDALEFEQSNRDGRPWTVSHPLFGTAIVQCVSLTQDVRGLASSTFRGLCIETIADDYPKTPDNPETEAAALQEAYGLSTDEVFTDADFKTTDQITLQDNINGAYQGGKDLIPNPTQFQEYYNFFTAASSAVLGATIAPLAAINTARSLYTYPLRLVQTARDRVNFLQEQFTTLFTEVSNITTFEQKRIFENNVGLTISASCVSAITPLTAEDYPDAVKVLEVQDIILEQFTSYLDQLGTLQADNALEPESFQPNFDALNILFELVYLTYSKLTEIALESKQERTIILPAATDLVNLTHQLYGLLETGENINRLQENNNLSFEEIIEIPKDRKIVYYV